VGKALQWSLCICFEHLGQRLSFCFSFFFVHEYSMKAHDLEKRDIG
jgi:hypothetical protein